MAEDFLASYQWDIRHQSPKRPEWLRAWPGGARMALQVIVLHEWESVPWHRSRPMPATAHHKFDFLALGGREYGARHGIWRLLDTLDRHGVKSTLVVNGLAAKLFPESVVAAHRRGHEIAAHQWDQSVFPPMFQSREEERSQLVLTMDELHKHTGVRTLGYMSPGPRPTPHTLGILAELGFKWTADYVDFDVPYLVSVNGKHIVSVGYATPGCIDFDLLSRGHMERLAEMKYMFHAAYEESKRHPMRFCYAVHAHWGGTVGMAKVLDDFLGHVRTHEGVWTPRCIDLAELWIKNAAT